MPAGYLDRNDPTGKIMKTARFFQDSKFSPLLKGIRLSILGMYGDEDAERQARECLAHNAYKTSLISMSVEPKDFDRLGLSADYNAYYVQVAGDKPALYYVDMKHRSIKKLPIKDNVDFDKSMSEVKKDQILSKDELDKITLLTGHTVPDIVRFLRDVLVARLDNKEWSERVHEELFRVPGAYHTDGVPFTDFEQDPAPISQIKKFVNALYHGEKALVSSEGLDLDRLTDFSPLTNSLIPTFNTIAGPISDDVYKLCRLVTQPDVDLVSTFGPEWDALVPVFNQLSSGVLAYSANANDLLARHHIDLSNPHGVIHQLGEGSGVAVNQLKPHQGNGVDYEFMTQFSADLPRYMTEMTNYLKELSLDVAGPGLDRAKLNELEGAAEKLLSSLNGLSPGATLQPLNALNLIHIIRHGHTLFMTILDEMGHLNEASQGVIRANLTELKYNYVSKLVAFTDKVEEEMVLRPGQLSGPLTAKVEPWYEYFVSLVDGWVDFSETGRDLKTLQDTRFVESRLEQAYQRQAENETQRVAERELAPASASFFEALLPHRGRRLSQLSRADKLVLIDQYKVIQPYIAALDLKLSNAIVRGLLADETVPQTWPNYLYESANWFIGGNVLTDHVGDYADKIDLILNVQQQLTDRFEKLSRTHDFKQKLNHDLIHHVYDSMDELTLHPVNPSNNLFLVDESPVLGVRSTLIGAARGTMLQGLTSEQALKLNQLYVIKEDKLTRATQAHQAFFEFLAGQDPQTPLHQLASRNSLRNLYGIFQPVMMSAMAENAVDRAKEIHVDQAMIAALLGENKGQESMTVGRARALYAQVQARYAREEHALHEKREAIQALALRLVQTKRAQENLVTDNGCCLIAMPRKPVEADLLTLSADYNSFYVKVENDKTALYFIDKAKKSITTLPLKQQALAVNARNALFDQTMSSVGLNKSLSNTELTKITLITGHFPDNAGEARATFLIKKPQYAAYISDLQIKLDDFFKLFSPSVQGAMTPGKRGYWAGLIGMFNLEEGVIPFPELEAPQTVLRQPEQVLSLKRLANCMFHLKEAGIQLELLDNNSAQVEYVHRVFEIQTHVRAANDLILDLRDDPYLAAIGGDLMRPLGLAMTKLQAMQGLYKPDSPNDDVNAEPRDVVFYIVNALAVLPKHIETLQAGKTLSPDDTKDLHAYADQVSMDVRRIIEGSDSYFKLMLETPTFVRLFNQLTTRYTQFAETTHDAVVNHLAAINDENLTAILLEADKWEAQLSLKPGLLTLPLKQVLATYYQGLLEPLNLSSQQHVALATSMKPFTKRRDVTVERITAAETSLAALELKRVAVDALLQAIGPGLTPQNAAGAVASFNALIPLIEEAMPHCQQAYREICYDGTLQKLLTVRALGADGGATLLADERLLAGDGTGLLREGGMIKGLTEVFKAYFDGLTASEEVARNTATDQRVHLEQQMLAQNSVNKDFIENYIKKAMKKQMEASYTAVYRGLVYGGKAYDEALFAYMKGHEDEFITRIKREEDIDEQVGLLLAEKMKIFEAEHASDYHQLAATHVAISRMKDYIHTQILGLKPGHQTWVFESHKTLSAKIKRMETLENIMTEDGLSVNQRIEKLRYEVKKPGFKAILLGYDTYNASTFGWLAKTFLLFLEALHLYKPERQSVYEGLLQSVNDPRIDVLETTIFRLSGYIKEQRESLKPGRQTWAFESLETLSAKEGLVVQLDAILKQETLSTHERIKQMHVLVTSLSFQKVLLDHHRYQPYTFAWLTQIVLAVFEALHVYTPERKAANDQLMKSVAPVAAPASMASTPAQLGLFGRERRAGKGHLSPDSPDVDDPTPMMPMR